MLKQLEQITVFTPLGIRFWDAAQDKQVSDNLTVTARTETTSQSIRAFRTASGIYAFQGLPWLHDVEYPVGDVALAASPPDTKRFIIEVEDQLERFLPVVFGVYLPLPYTGIFPSASQSSPPAVGPPGFYLFSAPTRSASPGLAVVRGHLVENDTGRPAAHTVLEARVGSKTWYGVADKRGCVAILFPYPTVTAALGTSPPGIPLSGQQWELTIRVRYSPAALRYPPGGEIPYLGSIFNQSPGVVWSTQAGPPVVERSLNLTFARELILRTGVLPKLWINTG